MSYAGDYSFADLQEGMECEREYHINSTVYNAFLETFGDTSRIHVDDAYAEVNGFKGRVMHGAIFNGFLSQFIGLHFPGRRSLLLACDIRYLKPCYLGDKLRLKAKVTQKLESRRVVVLDISFYNENQDYVTARSRVKVGVILE
ncbi:MAG: MaoC/PaaZ C-terminal domain-containing protein [Pyrinomonadaceae bacterium]